MPSAKLVGKEKYSIISDYIGKPTHAYNSIGNLVWSVEYDIYGDLRNFTGDKHFIPFRQLGQYEDVETGLYYNRFRYYNPKSGMYVSRDPIGLMGGFQVYGYVYDANNQVDIFGLSKGSGTLGNRLVRSGKTVGNNFVKSNFQAHHVIPHEIWTNNQDFFDDIGLAKSGRFNPKDAVANGIFMPNNQNLANSLDLEYFHSGSHSSYNRYVEAEVDRIKTAYDNGQLTKTKTRKQISKLQKDLKKELGAKRQGTNSRNLNTH
ncbi:AHH domain-containing protein (plasmid) [Bernardetia sp. Wsw4-3y2]|uniref:RHS repeat domain-containing protein n=1 Tax=Bernardetia sp. Wsw4-3y2 TaxID=3127471 RepID=UPI0030CCEE6A